MSSLVRFGVSLPKQLLDRFDLKIKLKGYQTRSEALRDLIRNYLFEHELEKNSDVAGTLTIVYDHHIHNLTGKLDEIQHDRHEQVLSKLHIHLDHHNCLEVIILRGKRKIIENLANKIIGIKGVKHGKLTFTSINNN